MTYHDYEKEMVDGKQVCWVNKKDKRISNIK